jgi:hypothetical protein
MAWKGSSSSARSARGAASSFFQRGSVQNDDDNVVLPCMSITNLSSFGKEHFAGR